MDGAGSHDRAKGVRPAGTGDGAPVHRAGAPTSEPIAIRAWPALVVAAGAYLVLAVLLWWNIWSSHPTTTTTCGCGDTSLFTWFLAWPPYAVAHGLDPLFSTVMFHPSGVNLLSNTAVVAIGLVLAPVTWLFGPVATLNVAMTLSPFLSALAMFVLVRRWVSWSPAAFIAGLLYGFSPFVLISLTDAHLMLGMAPVPPLVVAVLDGVLFRQRRHPVAVGATLGLLVAVQFFIGTEVLAIIGIAAVCGVVLVVLYGLRHREVLRARARFAVVAAVTAAVTAGAVLAYPVWFTLAGPAHLSGPVWGPGVRLSYGGATLAGFLRPLPPSAAATALARRFGGYQAPTLSGQYLGVGLVAVLVLGLVAWRRDRRLWIFGSVGLIALGFSLGLEPDWWTPWRLVVRAPLMVSVVPGRFVLVAYLCAAVMLGLVVDHAHRAAGRGAPLRAERPASRPTARSAPRRLSVGRGTGLSVGRGTGALAGAALSVIALAPIAAYFAGGLPLAATPVVLPRWFVTVAPHLAKHQVLLVLPVPFAFKQSAMTWQAVDGMGYDMVGGGGPGSLPERAGPERTGQSDLANVSISGSPQPVTVDEITAVRQALAGWGVTAVVLPDQAGLPGYEQVHLVRTTAVLVTAATGRAPVHQFGAWVWAQVRRPGPPVQASPGQLSRCTAGAPSGSTASIAASTACVLATSSGTPPATSSGTLVSRSPS